MAFRSNGTLDAVQPGAGLPSQHHEWEALFGQTGAGAGIPLGTSRWLDPEIAGSKFRYPGSLFASRGWIGHGFDSQTSPLGYEDDRHIFLTCGSRGGKGAGVIIPNLCFWPGSCVVVDPKGENATVTARRRGHGSEYTHGMGQKVCILDPFGEVQLPAELKGRFNPLDAIDPNSDFAVDDAARVAAALVVVQSKNDPYWEEAARNLIKGLILHVLSSHGFRDQRNLITVRRLLTQGDWLSVKEARPGQEEVSPFRVLWNRMRANDAFQGIVAGVGEQMIAMADKQKSGVLEAARTHTEFLDGPPMRRMLERSDFDLGELKTNPAGLTIYLVLPQRFFETHYRWLRLMIVLALGEMERIKGRPAAGHRTLFVLDEFPALKRMEAVENAAAQAAGFGVKFLFVAQNFPQLQEHYDKSWETFLGNSGLKLFFNIDDDFTRAYLSRQLGELETVRQTRSGSQSRSTSVSDMEGTGWSTNTSEGMTRSPWLGFRRAWQDSKGTSNSGSTSTSTGSSNSSTDGWGEGVHKRPLLNPDEIGRLLARIDDHRRPGYPGLVLAFVPGEHPLLARRVNYFQSAHFAGYFDPHPEHPPPPTLAELMRMARTPREQPLPLPPPPAAPTVQPLRSELIWGMGFVGVMVAIWVVHLLLQSGSTTASPSATSRPTATTSTSYVPQTSAAYAQAGVDWAALQNWFNAQTGSRRAGADYWAGNRSKRGHISCEQAADEYANDRQIGMQFLGGCHDAKRWLDPIDTRRADPEYRRGFNDAAKQ